MHTYNLIWETFISSGLSLQDAEPGAVALCSLSRSHGRLSLRIHPEQQQSLSPSSAPRASLPPIPKTPWWRLGGKNQSRELGAGGRGRGLQGPAAPRGGSEDGAGDAEAEARAAGPGPGREGGGCRGRLWVLGGPGRGRGDPAACPGARGGVPGRGSPLRRRWEEQRRAPSRGHAPPWCFVLFCFYSAR